MKYIILWFFIFIGIYNVFGQDDELSSIYYFSIQFLFLTIVGLNLINNEIKKRNYDKIAISVYVGLSIYGLIMFFREIIYIFMIDKYFERVGSFGEITVSVYSISSIIIIIWLWMIGLKQIFLKRG